MKFRNRSGQHSMWVIYFIPEWVKQFFLYEKIRPLKYDTGYHIYSFINSSRTSTWEAD